jgi:hypothetical protein
MFLPAAPSLLPSSQQLCCRKYFGQLSEEVDTPEFMFSHRLSRAAIFKESAATAALIAFFLLLFSKAPLCYHALVPLEPRLSVAAP